MLDTEPLCSKNTPSITATAAGSAPQAVCTYWDDVYQSVSFSPNTVTAPQTCTDIAPTWVYTVD